MKLVKGNGTKDTGNLRALHQERVIGPHLMAPLGTNQGSELSIKRAFACADRAVRVFAPKALDTRGRHEDAARLRALEPIVDATTALAGQAISSAVAYVAAFNYAVVAAFNYVCSEVRAALLALVAHCREPQECRELCAAAEAVLAESPVGSAPPAVAPDRATDGLAELRSWLVAEQALRLQDERTSSLVTMRSYSRGMASECAFVQQQIDLITARRVECLAEETEGKGTP